MHIKLFLFIWVLGYCCETQASSLTDVAFHKPTAQGPATWINPDYSDPTTHKSENAVDGIEDTEVVYCTHTTEAKLMWWMVDLQATYRIYRVAVLNRDSMSYRLQNFTIDVFMNDPRAEPDFPVTLGNICAYRKDPVGVSQWAEFTCDPRPIIGRFVRVVKSGYEQLTLCEVKVFAPSIQFGRTFERTPNTKSLTEPQHFLGVFSSAMHCALVMLQYTELNVNQINHLDGRCLGSKTVSGKDIASDEPWSLYIEA